MFHRLKDQDTDEQSNESKSTQAWSKKFDDICDDDSDKNKNKDEDEHNEKKNIFELSSKTKNIINSIYNKKKEEKLNKINNKENDSSLMKIPEEQSSPEKKSA